MKRRGNDGEKEINPSSIFNSSSSFSSSCSTSHSPSPSNSNRVTVLLVTSALLALSLLPNYPDQLLTSPLLQSPQDMKLSYLKLITIYSTIYQSVSAQIVDQGHPGQPLNTDNFEQIKTEKQKQLPLTAHLQLTQTPLDLQQQQKQPQHVQDLQPFDLDMISTLNEGVRRRRRNVDTDTYKDDVASFGAETDFFNLKGGWGVDPYGLESEPAWASLRDNPREDARSFECADLDVLFPEFESDPMKKDDACVYEFDNCGANPYKGSVDYDQVCTPKVDLISVVKGSPIDLNNRQKNHQIQSLSCNTSKSLECYLSEPGRTSTQITMRATYTCMCNQIVGKKSYDKNTDKCFIPFGESIEQTCDPNAEVQKMRHRSGDEIGTNDKQQSENTSAVESVSRQNPMPMDMQTDPQHRAPKNRPGPPEKLLCKRGLQCARKSITPRPDTDTKLFRDYHCYCSEGYELDDAQGVAAEERQCRKTDKDTWRVHVSNVVTYFLGFAAIYVVFGSAIQSQFASPYPGFCSRGFRRKPPRPVGQISSINKYGSSLELSGEEQQRNNFIPPDNDDDAPPRVPDV